MDRIKRKARAGRVFYRSVADGENKYRVTRDVRRFANGEVVYRCDAVDDGSEWFDGLPIYIAEEPLLAALERAEAQARRSAR